MDNKRTMKFILIDHWSRPVYKCIETNILCKDINLGENEICLYSCQNEIDGEPESPIKKSLEIVFIDKYKVDENEFNYMMLSRLKSDCDAHLGISNRKIKNCKNHIEEMKRIYNIFPENKKPQWLTYDKILEYEKLMIV